MTKPSGQVKERPPVLRALGRNEAPQTLEVQGRAYERKVVFKHDSWATTCLYEAAEPTGEDDRIVAKFNRQQSIFGLPMTWLGRWLAVREAEVYRRLADVENVPKFLGCIGKTGVAHTFVPGEPLAPQDELSEDFLRELDETVRTFHARDVAVVDLQKCENVLRGEDGRPYLMDFQISWALPAGAIGRFPPLRWLHGVFVHSDRYHVQKHYYRFRRDLLTEEQVRKIERKPLAIRIHRALTRPLQQFRRQVLVWLKVRKPGGKATSELKPEAGVERRQHEKNSPDQS